VGDIGSDFCLGLAPPCAILGEIYPAGEGDPPLQRARKREAAIYELCQHSCADTFAVCLTIEDNLPGY